MSDTWWVIKDSAGGLRQVLTDGAHPSAAGENVTGATVKQMSRKGNFDTELPDLTTGGWKDNVEPLRQRLLDQIDAVRERRQAVYLTPGEAKKMIYAQKMQEVQSYRSLTAAVLATLSTKSMKSRFPALSNEADVSGKTILDVVVQIETTTDAINAAVYKIEADVMKIKRDLRAATTVAAARAAVPAGWLT